MKWSSINVNVQFSLINSLSYLTLSSVRAVFGRPLPGFHSIADPCSSTHLQIAFTEQSFQPFSRNFATIVWYPKPSFRNVLIRALSSYDILLITKVIGLTVTMTWNIEEFRAYYNAMLHINIIMMSQQKWYLLLHYFNNKINFLFSCEIRSWSLCFCQFDICQVNTAQSNTLVHSIMPKKWAKFGATIFRHFWDIAIFVLGYFILPHPVHCI